MAQAAHYSGNIPKEYAVFRVSRVTPRSSSAGAHQRLGPYRSGGFGFVEEPGLPAVEGTGRKFSSLSSILLEVATMFCSKRHIWGPAGLCLLLGLALGLLARNPWSQSRGQAAGQAGQAAPSANHHSRKLAPDSDAAYDPNWDRPYPHYQPLGKTLQEVS
jgi:hypothetical protein